MNRSKLRFSLLIILISVSLLVTGTFAWFLVGGFAQLGDLSLTVIEAGDGVEIQGSAETAYVVSADDEEKLILSDWGKTLMLDNFNDGEFLHVLGTNPEADEVAGTYSPVSPASFRSTPGEISQFIRVGVNGTFFKASDAEAALHYNDFSVNLRSENESKVDVEVTLNIYAADGAQVNATTAGRVAITYNGITKIFALDDVGAMSVVNSTFADDTIEDRNGNHIIDSSEGSSVLVSRDITKLEVVEEAENGEVKLVCTGKMLNSSGDYINNDGSTTNKGHGYVLEGVAPKSGSSTIYIQTWLEGNDPDCVDFEDNSIASGSFIVDIGFSAYKSS